MTTEIVPVETTKPLILPLTEVIELDSREGWVGSIQAWNIWDSRRSHDHARYWVSKVASISYGNDEAKNPTKLFNDVWKRKHLSCMEFIPIVDTNTDMHLPGASLRSLAAPDAASPFDCGLEFSDRSAEYGMTRSPAHAFLVTCPLYIRSHWHRHRSQAFLEMSRRYTKASKREYEFYYELDPEAVKFHEMCLAEYRRRLSLGKPQELARGAIPVEAMTTFWAASFDLHWLEFLQQRASAHAQKEIEVFASWIQNYLGSLSSL